MKFIPTEEEVERREALLEHDVEVCGANNTSKLWVAHDNEVVAIFYDVESPDLVLDFAVAYARLSEGDSESKPNFAESYVSRRL